MSMGARREITKKHAAEYAKASKRDKGVLLDQLVGATGWSRANARRALTAAGKREARPVLSCVGRAAAPTGMTRSGY